jgi:hypothetical protein
MMACHVGASKSLILITLVIVTTFARSVQSAQLKDGDLLEHLPHELADKWEEAVRHAQKLQCRFTLKETNRLKPA